VTQQRLAFRHAPALATIPAGNASVSSRFDESGGANTVANISASWNGTTVQSPLTITRKANPLPSR